MRLNNKVAIVTDGGAGVGEASATRFAHEGARAVVCEISRSAGNRPLTQSGRLEVKQFLPRRLSLTNPRLNKWFKLLYRVLGESIFSSITLLCSFPTAKFRAHEMSNEEWDRSANGSQTDHGQSRLRPELSECLVKSENG